MKKSKKKTVLIVIAVIVLAIIGVVTYFGMSSSKTTQTMKTEIKQEVPEVVSEYTSDDLSYDINFYSKDSTTADYIAINVKSNVYKLNETQLNLAEKAAKLINGLNLEYTKTGDNLDIKALIQVNKINQEMIDLAQKIDLVDESSKGLLESIASGNLEAIKTALNAAGYRVWVSEN